VTFTVSQAKESARVHSSAGAALVARLSRPLERCLAGEAVGVAAKAAGLNRKKAA